MPQGAAGHRTQSLGPSGSAPRQWTPRGLEMNVEAPRVSGVDEELRRSSKLFLRFFDLATKWLKMLKILKHVFEAHRSNARIPGRTYACALQMPSSTASRTTEAVDSHDIHQNATLLGCPTKQAAASNGRISMFSCEAADKTSKIKAHAQSQ